MESLGLFYRYLTPIHPWILYLLYSESPNMQLLSLDSSNSAAANVEVDLKKHLSNNGIDDSNNTVSPTLFTVLLCILYLIFKLNQIYAGIFDIARSFRELLGNLVSFCLFE